MDSKRHVPRPVNLEEADDGVVEFSPLNQDDEGTVTIEVPVPEERAAWGSKMQFMLSCISLSVGLGNVWRFPYLVQQDGGGAFLIPYLIMMVLEGAPLFLLELGIGQRLRQGSLGVWNFISPWWGGLGVASTVVSYLVGLYYNVIIAWCFYYLFNSFKNPLPFGVCPNETLPGENVSKVVRECDVSSETAYFWYRQTIDASPSIDETGGIKWWMACCLTLSWVLVWLCIMKGIQSSGKVQANILQEEVLQNILKIRRLIRKRRRRRPQVWIRSWLTEQQRLDHSQYYRLVQKLRTEDPNYFKSYMRMPLELFDEILERVRPAISGPGTNTRASLDPGLKLALTLRHLATGDQYPSLGFNYRVSKTAICRAIPKVCEAIVEAYKEEVIKFPTSPGEWKKLAMEFERRWQVPHAIGALDGKHIKIKQPANSGSEYWCVYKHCYSIILMALVDADYKFIWVDTGGVGHMSDAQIFNESELKECIENGTVCLPPSERLPQEQEADEDGAVEIPYFILGDDAFALRTYMMKPWSKRNMTKEELVYNYRISRGRRVVENAFGIMANRWRCLLTTLYQSPDVVRSIVECCVVLHNLMRIRNPAIHSAEVDHEDRNYNVIPGIWRQEVDVHNTDNPPPDTGRNRATQAAKDMRLYLQRYFNDQRRGGVPWQDQMITLNRH